MIEIYVTKLKEKACVRITGHSQTNEPCARVSTVFECFLKLLQSNNCVEDFKIGHGKSFVSYLLFNSKGNEDRTTKLYHTVFYDSFKELAKLYPNMVKFYDKENEING